MSSAGSPAWASSQSSTPRSPAASTRRLPQRKSPCTVTRGPGSGRCAASQRAPSSSAGRTSPSASSRGRGSRSGSARGRPATRSGSMAWMAARARPHCAARAARAIGPGRVAENLAGDGLALEPLDHQPGRADVVVLAQGDDARDRDAGASGRLEQVALGPHGARVGPRPRSTWRMSGRRPPSDSRSNALVTREAPPESRCRSCTVPPRRRPSAPASSSLRVTLLTGAPLLDRDDRPPGLIELVQVLADAVTGARLRLRRGRRRSNGPVPR